MRAWAGAALLILVSVVAARADDVQTAREAVSSTLQKDGGGLVPFQAACPQKNADPWGFVSSSVVVPIDKANSAVLVNVGMCDGGNGHGQFLVILENGTPHLVQGTEIGDMSFIGLNMFSDGDSVTLYGDRWLKSDAHCCPSKKATLEYNLKTHQHKLAIVGSNK
jgi:hypothetical protein